MHGMRTQIKTNHVQAVLREKQAFVPDQNKGRESNDRLEFEICWQA